ncbi:MAG: hypothetical protein J7L69_12365 [Desulfobulbaceae bacterium]|nr:hypothetical protein [Desulfobulbaceae bacterium]
MSDNELFKINVCLKLPAELMEGLKDVASVSGMTQDELITLYVAEGISNAMPKVKRQLFFNRTKEILAKHNVPSSAVDEIVDKFTF